jgi:predicted dehydrogenase
VNGSRVSVGLVGLGYWGPNLARNFAALPECELAWCCDADAERRERFAGQFPSARFTDDLDELLGDPALDAVVLATPVPTPSWRSRPRRPPDAR